MPILKRPARAVGAEAFAITSSRQSANADPHTPNMPLPGVSNITEQIVARGLPVSAHAPCDDDGIVSDIPDEECDLDGCDDNFVDPVTDSEEEAEYDAEQAHYVFELTASDCNADSTSSDEEDASLINASLIFPFFYRRHTES